MIIIQKIGTSSSFPFYICTAEVTEESGGFMYKEVNQSAHSAIVVKIILYQKPGLSSMSMNWGGTQKMRRAAWLTEINKR